MGSAKSQAFYLVPDILAKGRILSSESGIHGNQGLTGHMVGAPVRIGGEDYVAIAIVRADANKHGFYVHEVVLREKLQAASKTGAEPTAQPDGAAKPGAIRSIIQSIMKFNPYSVSKAIDGNGEPLVTHHGTTSDFSEFDLERPTKNGGYFGKGIYLKLLNAPCKLLCKLNASPIFL